jgi:hypothetical protein
MCTSVFSFWVVFLTHLFFGITRRSTLHVTFDMRDSTSYADLGLKMRDTFALATVFDSEVGPAAPLSLFQGKVKYRVLSVSPTSKSQQTLATAKFLIHFIISIAVL